MSIKLETLLHTEMADEFDALANMEKGSDEHKVTVDSLTKLMDRAIELDKLNIEHEKEIETRKFENDLKLEQFKEEKKDRMIKNILTGFSIALPFGGVVWGVCKSLKFEETGTITTAMGRGLLQKLIPKMK